jgi:crotonobetainyl-CoA:carnitine CoA-transferase CaiB-like acyl-CoA transferase
MHPQVVPYQPVKTADKWMILGVGSDNVWDRFCAVAGLEHLQHDPRFRTNAERVRHRDELMAIILPIMEERSAQDWLAALHDADIPAGPINTVAEVMTDPQLAARGMIVTLEHPLLGTLRSLAMPVHFALTPASYRRYPPMIGEHSAEILRELGYGSEQIDALTAQGIVQVMDGVAVGGTRAVPGSLA